MNNEKRSGTATAIAEIERRNAAPDFSKASVVMQHLGYGGAAVAQEQEREAGSAFYVVSQTYYGLATVTAAEALIAKEKANDAECIAKGLRDYTQPRSHSIKGFNDQSEAEQNLCSSRNVLLARQPDGTLKFLRANWDSR